MGRDPDLMRRMYGAPAPARRPAVRPALWLVAAAAAFVGSVGGALAVLWTTAASAESELEAWGVIDPDELELAVHDHPPNGGCVITGRRVVRWDDRRRTGATELVDATVVVEPGQVRIVGPRPDTEVVCPFAPGEDPAAFVAVARRFGANR